MTVHVENESPAELQARQQIEVLRQIRRLLSVIFLAAICIIALLVSNAINDHAGMSNLNSDLNSICHYQQGYGSGC